MRERQMTIVSFIVSFTQQHGSENGIQALLGRAARLRSGAVALIKEKHFSRLQ